MCGIAGIHRFTDRPIPMHDRFVSELLRGIESRGRDATGFVSVNDEGDIRIQKASCTASIFNAYRLPVSPSFRTVLLHTRYATQGKPEFPENNHPVFSGPIYAVHNGHIWNDNDLFYEVGMPRIGAVDSEVIPAVIRANGWDRIVESLALFDGAMATAIINAKRPGELMLARGYDSPLYAISNNDFVVWASTREAIVHAWSKAIGTPPSEKRIEWFAEGTAVMVNGSEFETHRFEPPRRPVYYGGKGILGTSYQWNPSVKVEDEKDEGEGDGNNVAGCSIVPVDRNGGGVVKLVWNGDELVDAEYDEDEKENEPEIDRCMDCGDWGVLELVNLPGFAMNEYLCDVCAKWARKGHVTL
jgi:predicted glutamine amidotransferase